MNIDSGNTIKYRFNNYIQKLSEYYSDKREKDKKFEYLRINSLDFFRGILILCTMIIINQGLESNILDGLKISEWNGNNFADYILPFYILIMASSIPFFVKKNYENGDTLSKIIKKVFIRFILIFILGVLYSTVFYGSKKLLRLTGPFQLISFNYLLCSILYIGILNSKMKNNVIVYVFLLLGLVMSLIMSLLGIKNGISIDNNIFVNIDNTLLFGFRSTSISDPEGVLACISSLSLGFFGISLGCILNKKIINKKYIHYKRPNLMKSNGATFENFKVDLLSWINIKSLKSIYSNYYRLNNDLKKIIHMLVFSMIFIIIGLITNIWFPYNRNLFSISFVCKVSSIFYLLEAVSFILCDILNFEFAVNLIKKIGRNSIAIIFVVSIVHNIFRFIKIKSIYTSTWMSFNNWFTTDLILPVTGIDYASLVYSLGVTFIWLLIFNILEKYDIKFNI